MQWHPAWVAQQLVFDAGLLMVKLVEFDVDGITQMATMSLASRQQRFSFVGASRIDTPFLGARDDHRGMKGLNFLFRACSHLQFPW
jgi:hypothetical protein